MASIIVNISDDHKTLQITDISETDGTSFTTVDLEIVVFTNNADYVSSTPDYVYQSLDILAASLPTTEAPIELTTEDFDDGSSAMTETTFVDGIYKYTITFKTGDTVEETYSTTFLVIYNSDVLVTLDISSMMRSILGDKNTKHLDDAFETNWEIATLDTILFANVVGLVQESLEIKDYLDELLENN